MPGTPSFWADGGHPWPIIAHLLPIRKGKRQNKWFFGQVLHFSHEKGADFRIRSSWLYNLFTHGGKRVWYNNEENEVFRLGGSRRVTRRALWYNKDERTGKAVARVGGSRRATRRALRGGVRLIAFDRVSKRYGVHRALQEISFQVPKGQVLGLLGQNGAGKTTLMNILTGCLAPSEGRASIGGHDVLTQPREAKRLMGYLPEQAPLYGEMTVEAYLRFACELKEVEKRAIPAHVSEIAEKTGLTDVLGRKIGNLSKGYRQRVGMAQALCGAPEVIILDEPTAGLDPRQSSDMRKLVRALAGEHTVLFSSHILSEVQAVCDRIVILHHGKIICDSGMQALRCGEQRLRAVIACGEGALLPALRQLSSVSRVEVERGGEPGFTQAVLTVKAGCAAERELFTLLSAMQAPLMRLSPVEDSLEDIFLRATMDE